jgi:hypothetical protein
MTLALHQDIDIFYATSSDALVCIFLPSAYEAFDLLDNRIKTPRIELR